MERKKGERRDGCTNSWTVTLTIFIFLVRGLRRWCTSFEEERRGLGRIAKRKGMSTGWEVPRVNDWVDKGPNKYRGGVKWMMKEERLGDDNDGDSAVFAVYYHGTTVVRAFWYAVCWTLMDFLVSLCLCTCFWYPSSYSFITNFLWENCAWDIPS